MSKTNKTLFWGLFIAFSFLFATAFTTDNKTLNVAKSSQSTVILVSKNLFYDQKLATLAHSVATYLAYDLGRSGVTIYFYDQNSTELVFDGINQNNLSFGTLDKLLDQNLHGLTTPSTKDGTLEILEELAQNLDEKRGVNTLLITDGLELYENYEKIVQNLKILTDQNQEITLFRVGENPSNYVVQDAFYDSNLEVVEIESIFEFNKLFNYVSNTTYGSSFFVHPYSNFGKVELKVENHSNNSTILLVKSAQNVAPQIKNPEGKTLSSYDYLEETPHLVLLKNGEQSIFSNSTDAEPSENARFWQITTWPNDGMVGVFEGSSNEIELALFNEVISPNTEFVLSAAPVINGVVVYLGNTSIDARFLDLDEQVVLNDLAQNGDILKGDGIFSAKVEPKTNLSSLRVQLTLSLLPDGDAVSTTHTLKVVQTPTVTYEEILDISINPSSEWLIGTFSVDRGYEEVMGQLTVSLVGESRNIDTRIDYKGGGDEKSTFDVWGSANTGEYALVVNLGVNVADQSKEDGSNLVLREFSTPFVITNSFFPSLKERPSWLFGLPMWSFMLALVTIFLFASLLLILGTRYYLLIKPYGYLRDESGHTVVDFTKIKRSFLKKLLRPNVVSTDEVPILQALNAKLVFKKDKIVCQSSAKSKRIDARIDGKPIQDKFELYEGSRLGVGGRFFRMSLKQLKLI